MATPLRQNEAMTKVPASILSCIFQKETSLKNHLLYSCSILDTLDSVKCRGTSGNHSFAFNVLNVLKGGTTLIMSLLNNTEERRIPNTVHKENLFILNLSDLYKDT